MFTGCASQQDRENQVAIAIKHGQPLKIIVDNNDLSFIRNEITPTRSRYFVENATAMAVYYHNMDVIEYLISIDAIHKVYPAYFQSDGIRKKTTYAVPAAELACNVGAFEIMELLHNTYPDQKVNYTNCLHNQMSSQKIHYVKGTTQSDLNKRIERALELGGEINVMPEYGRHLLVDIFEVRRSDPDQFVTPADFDERIRILSRYGLDPNTQSPFLLANETLLTMLAYEEDESLSAATAKFLVEQGADVNAKVERSIVVGYDTDLSKYYKYQTHTVTALHMARFYSRNDLATALIKLGADQNAVDESGNSADAYAGVFAKIEAAGPYRIAKQKKEKKQGGPGVGTATSIINIGEALMGF